MMIARDWVLTYLCNALWQIPLLWCAAAVAAPLVRGIGRRAEHRVWVMALLLGAGLPAVSPQFMLALHVPWAHESLVTRTAGAVSAAQGLEQKALLGLPGWVLNAVCAVYLVCLLVLAARFFLNLRRLRGMASRADAPPLPREIEAQWREVCSTYALGRTRLGLSLEIASPVAFGRRTPTVLLPTALVERAGLDEIGAALAHEGAHLHRGDFAKHMVYTLVSLPVAMHPVTWMLRARVAESREMVCDALAARVLGGAESYVSALLSLAALLPRLPAFVNANAIGIFDANTLERRVMTMMEQRKDLGGVSRIWACLCAGVIGMAACGSALALHVSVGSLADSGTSAHVYSIGGEVKAPKIISSVDPSFPATAAKSPGGVCVLKVVVDAQGKPVDVRVVRSLRPDFDAEAVKAVKKYLFKPATRKGEAVAVEINIEMNFQRF